MSGTRWLGNLAALGLVAGACTLGARDDEELSGQWGEAGADGGGDAASCAAGTRDCDGVAANGCETLVDKDPKNCGACGNVCASDGGKTPVCAQGQCGLSDCVAPMADCDGDGTCETDTSSSLDHCGFCEYKCVLSNAKSVCAKGCQIEECSPGFENCDGIASNGCETPLNTATDCGFCGAGCALANATTSCSTGTCTITACNAGYGDCDKLPETGCESNTQTDPKNCGSCGNACSAGQVCKAGECVVSGCTPPMADCDGNPANCETDTSTSAQHCGFCENPCTLPHATAACSAGKCVVASCASGWGDCDGIDANGCETKLGTSSNCKSCGDQCGGPNVAAADCAAAGCNVTCAPGFANCNGAVTDGCEAQLATDPLHCGSCTKNCSVGAPQGTQPGCTGGACTYNCATGTADCDGNGSCETNVNTSPLHCGQCGRSCEGAACLNGFCAPTVVVAKSNITSFDEAGSDLVFGRNPGGVFRVNKAGGAVTTLSPQPSVWLDVYQAYIVSASPTEIVRIPNVNGSAGSPVQLAAASGTVQLEVVSGGDVFWTSSQQALRRIGLGGGTPDVYDPGTGGLGVRGGTTSSVYWAVPGAGEVRWSSSGSPNVQVLASGQGEPAFIARGGGYVFWSASADGAIRRAPEQPGPTTVTTLASNQPGAHALTANDQHVYWGIKGTGGIWRVPITGGQPVKLVDSATGVTCLRVGATHLFWSDSTGIKRVPR